MPVSDWFDLMADTVVYEPVASRDGEAKPTYGTSSSYRARVVYKEIRTSNRASGQDAIGAGEVWLGAIIYPNIDDRITLPDGSQPIIINWNVFTDENGPHHTVIIFGGTQSGVSRA